MSFWKSIAERIAAATEGPFSPATPRVIGGGCINEAVILEDGSCRFFVKTNRSEYADMFAAEAEGLVTIAATRTVRVPQVVCHDVADGRAFLALEYLPLGGHGGDEALGRALAAMHGHGVDRFGWHRDNTIGSTPQPNTWSDDWIVFLRERRLGQMLERVGADGGEARLLRLGEELLGRLGGFFVAYTPVSSLLHGDLWGGNRATLDSGEPVIFDPAVYYGDREADLAMTELFGGFSPRFYAAYREAWPLDVGYAVRKDLYNLYHVLNHYLLFGGGYGRQAESLMLRLLAQLR
jgi:fructosamine-3-kinase